MIYFKPGTGNSNVITIDCAKGGSFWNSKLTLTLYTVPGTRVRVHSTQYTYSIFEVIGVCMLAYCTSYKLQGGVHDKAENGRLDVGWSWLLPTT